jgi:hypothetical protein
MKPLSFVLLCALIAGVGCSSDLMTGPEEPLPALAKNTVKMVPLKGSYTWEVVPSPDPTQCFMHTVLQGSGQGTHVGHFDIQQSHCFAYPPSLPTLETVDGHATITAANGDQLEFTYEGDFTHLFGPEGPIAVHIEGEIEVVGGTGRFEGATGSGTYLGSAPYPVTAGSMTFEGVISSVGSIK